ncbi:MAG: hypothetical protein A3F75_07970 [Betaproteobacteria bacterium RIFCSPLOWO2_12_FULL_64_23]|nr:MAG: hypothetical protein A3F75_07970 [Betaproteobacteria bacterium RIFCSPLOWO2_12_FULL_64_23]
MNLTQQRMVVWVTAAQRVETDALMSEVDFTAHESMRPIWIDREGSAEQIDVAVLRAAAQEDHSAFERGAEVELEAFGEAAPLGCEFSAGGGLGAIDCDITGGDARQGFDIGEVVALPDLALPQPIEAFDGILEARLARWGEDRYHLQRQTQPADTSDGVGGSMCSLEYCGVVKLRVSGQPVTAPALDQGLQRGPSAGSLHDPGLGQCAVQAGTGEHIDKGAAGDLQVLDEIEAIEFGSPTGQIGQIPALGRCRPALSVYAIKCAATHKHSVNRHARGNWLTRLLMLQGQANGVGSVLAQHALFTQYVSNTQNALFHVARRAVPGPASLATVELHPVDALAPRTRNPVGRRAHAYTELSRNRSQASPRANRLNQLTAAAFTQTFLGMTSLPIQIRERYTKSKSVGSVHVFRHTTGQRRRARGNSSRPTGSFRFPALPSSIIHRGVRITLKLKYSINAETRPWGKE